MTPNTHESFIALKAVHWYVESIYGQDINLSSNDAIEEHFMFVKEHNDVTLETYWNDFVLRHNRSVDQQKKIPFINHQDSL